MKIEINLVDLAKDFAENIGIPTTYTFDGKESVFTNIREGECICIDDLLKDYSHSDLVLLNQPLLVVDKIWKGLLSEAYLVFNISLDSAFEIEWFLYSDLLYKIENEIGSGTVDEIFKFAPKKWNEKLIPNIGDRICFSKLFSEYGSFGSWRTQDIRDDLNDVWIELNPVVIERQLISNNKLIIYLALTDYSDE